MGPYKKAKEYLKERSVNGGGTPSFYLRFYYPQNLKIVLVLCYYVVQAVYSLRPIRNVIVLSAAMYISSEHSRHYRHTTDIVLLRCVQSARTVTLVMGQREYGVM